LLRRITICVAALTLAGCDAAGRMPPERVVIGALLPLTGALASYGESGRAALAEAVAAINARGGPRLTLAIEDTRTDPATALGALTKLAGQGITLVVGPYASSEVKAAKSFADEHGVILISPLSTARSLAVAGDNVFRFTPDDEREAAAVAALAASDGVRVIIPLTRDDEGNRGLQAAFKPAFERRGGRTLEAVTYGANQADFADTARRLLDTAVRARRADPGGVGVYLTAFDEVVGLFNQIAAANGSDEALAGVKWYGSDSVAQSRALVANPGAAVFALGAGYPNPILGLDERSRATWGPVAERIAARLGRVPDAFALAAYDALMVGYAALVQAGDGAGAEARHREVTVVANVHDGLTGRTMLNAAGDRVSDRFDFWAICRVGGRLAWGKAAVYADGEARRVPGCDQRGR
jgi:branched-chain amino acid transport system substrate-binding protein